MTKHTIDLDGMLMWLEDQKNNYVTYASSSDELGKNMKRLDALLRGGYRVTHGNRVVYEGSNGRSAVDAYNAI